MDAITDLETRNDLVAPFDGLQFDVDLQTGVGTKPTGITEDNFTRSEAEGLR